MLLFVSLFASTETSYENDLEEIDTELADEWESRYFVREEIVGCYSRMNELSVNMDAGELCLTLDSLKNEECDIIPEGVYVDVELSNNLGITLRMKNEEFSYVNTEEICSSCPSRTIVSDLGLVEEKADCTILEGTDAAKVAIKSLTKWTDVTIGKIRIGHSEYTKCYEPMQAKIYLAKDSVRIDLVRTHLCDNVRDNCADLYYEMDMIFLIENGSELLRIITKSNNDLYFELSTEGVSLFADGDFSDILDLGIEVVELKLYLGCNVTAIFITECYAVLSKDLAEPFLNPELRIWPDHITILASPIPEAASYDALYYNQMKCYTGSVQFYDVVNQGILAAFTLKGTEFSFLDVERRNFWCNAMANETRCLEMISDLIYRDTNSMRVESSYWFYAQENCTDLITYATAYITNIRDTCWSGAVLVYKAGEICARPQINPEYTYCDFVEETNSTVKITLGDIIYEINTEYSINTEEICYSCAGNDSCTAAIAAAWRQKAEELLTIININKELTYELTVTEAFCEDYEPLFAQIELVAIAAAAALIIVTAIVVIDDLKLCTSKTKKNLKIELIEDL